MLTLLLAASTGASSVQGSFVVNGVDAKPAYIYAVARPDPYDASKEAVELLVSAKPIPEKDVFEIFPGDGTRLSAVIGSKGTLYGVVLLHERRNLSTSAAGVAFDKKTMDASRIAGRIHSKGELTLGSLNPLRLRFDITFDAPVLREKKGT
jgi:hypothetical protein